MRFLSTTFEVLVPLVLQNHSEHLNCGDMSLGPIKAVLSGTSGDGFRSMDVFLHCSLGDTCGFGGS